MELNFRVTNGFTHHLAQSWPAMVHLHTLKIMIHARRCEPTHPSIVGRGGVLILSSTTRHGPATMAYTSSLLSPSARHHSIWVWNFADIAQLLVPVSTCSRQTIKRRPQITSTHVAENSSEWGWARGLIQTCGSVTNMQQSSQELALRKNKERDFN